MFFWKERMPNPDARPAGWVNCYSICASAMLRAQNMTEKGSILKQRQKTLLIWVYNLSMHNPYPVYKLTTLTVFEELICSN